MLLDVTAADAPKLNMPLRRIEFVVIFHVTTNRNAWHLTTSRRGGYTFESLGKAKAFCEYVRKQGTYFRIYEVPAIACCSDDMGIVITQVNTEEAFKTFKTHKVVSLDALLPLRTLTLGQVSIIYGKSSDYWPEELHRCFSILTLKCDELKSLTMAGNKDDWIVRVSIPEGKNKSFRWAEAKSGIKSKWTSSVTSKLVELLANR